MFNDHVVDLYAMTRSHDARAVANVLIKRGIDGTKPRDPLQLIKLTYLCHGWMLGLYSRPLSAQPVEAWRYGPVIPDVYHGLKRHGTRPVNVLQDFPSSDFDELETDLIEQVFDVYSDFTGVQLSQLTHARGTPWYQTWYRTGRNSIIPDELIEEHFSELAVSGE